MVKTTLDIGETAPARATEVTREFRSSSLGVLLSVFAVAAGALLVELFRSDSWSTPVRAVVTVSGSLAVVIVLDRGRWLWELISAIRHQRDKARERLMEIKEASLKYKVVPTGADTAPRNEDALLRVLIENRGRGARFAVVIERISGTEEPLLDSFSPLYWMGRKGVLDEEIPPGEGRLIGVGYISPRDNTYWFTPLSPDSRPYSRSYRLTEGVTTICLRVSVRGLPEISYTRWIDVSITWDGPGSEYFVGLGPDPDPPDKSETIPTMAALLDF